MASSYFCSVSNMFYEIFTSGDELPVSAIDCNESATFTISDDVNDSGS